MRRVRIYIVCFSLILVSLIFLFHKHMKNPKGVIGYLTDNQEGIVLCFSEYEMPVRGLEIEGATYFFLPSFIELKQLDYSASDIRLYTESGELIDNPEINTTLTVTVELKDGSRVPYRVGFYKSENLYTMDIQLNGMQSDEIKRREYSDAKIKVYSPFGDTVYDSRCIKIQGRGNLTWASNKKPYEIRLPEKASLAGLQKSDNWTLLANATDPTSMKNRIAFDLSKILGMEYSTESDWIDLYINGEYMGNYLICHEPGIGHDRLNITNLEKINENFFENSKKYEEEDEKGYIYEKEVPYDISGGYLMEYTPKDMYDKKECGFIIDGRKCFVIKSPDNASKKEVEYVSRFTQSVDRMLNENAQDGQYNIINRPSFAQRYLVEEIVMNQDAGFASYLCYKKRGEDTMYAGPCWDYDKTCGYGLGAGKDYTSIVLGADEYTIGWDNKLIENEEYNEYVWEIFAEKTDAINKLINETIDEYYERLSPSLEMNRKRWPELADAQYDSVYDNVRYLKFFLFNRVQYLADINGTGKEFNEPDIYEGVEHHLTYRMRDGSQVIKSVKDGAQIKTDKTMYYSKFPETSTCFVPVFEDMEVICDDAE